MSVESDLEFYFQNRDEFLQYLGQFLLIKDSQLIGVYPTYQAALDEALALFGTAPFLVKEVIDPEPQEVI